MNVADLRQDYRAGALRRGDMAADPFQQFALWFGQALDHGQIAEANAAALATAGKDGRVTNRTVLLKAWDERGFVFYTNYESVKARQMAENAHASLLFGWIAMERQIVICGRAEKVSREESLAYFRSRPRESQLGAWVSEQSQIIESREVLEKKLEELMAGFGEGEIPLPDFWGGYRIAPETMEFWQGRTSRLHDRFLYSRADGGGWTLQRLSP